MTRVWLPAPRARALTPRARDARRVRVYVSQGGEEHGEKCSGDSCPLIRSRRSFDKASGMMLVELERTLPNGELVKTRTYYAPHEAT